MIIVAKCIKKSKDASGRNNLYLIEDVDKKQVTVNSRQLKDAMLSNKILITNMEIDDAGRLKEKTLSKAEELLEYIYHVVHGRYDDCDYDPEYDFEDIEDSIEYYFSKKVGR